MPLNKGYATKLIEKARQAPYGKGTETLVDTSVRNTWELDASQFTFQEPEAWDTFIQQTCAAVALYLGIQGPIEAEIYKMLLYEEGAMFKPHTDTEKIPGMFGTLVVSMPSKHQGGDLVLKHGGSTKVFQTSTEAASFACWYADVSHEILPVTSGYRWVLTYNLTLDTSSVAGGLPPVKPSADALLQKAGGLLRQTIKKWALDDSEEFSSQELVYHVLGHKYTQENLSFQALKGRDLAQAEALEQACDGLPIEVFLAILQRREEWHRWGGGHEDYDSEDEDRDVREYEEIIYTVKDMKPLHGNYLRGEFPVKRRNLLEGDCFLGMDPDEEDEHYAGNEVCYTLAPFATTTLRLYANRYRVREGVQRCGTEERYVNTP